MDMKLLHLAIDNFKGCKHLALGFQGRCASIYGDNAAGKTTIYDAFTWLLFGKDSRGRGDFEIKPLDPGGQVADHAAVTAVEATLDVDGVPLQLRRTYFERWSVKRGGGEATYDGNTSEYFVDGVPMKKSEYENRIRELVSEDVFRVLTNVSWFCEGMDWRRRRDMLFQVCELPRDKDIMAADPRFEPLSAAMGGLSMEDYKRKIQAERKGLNAGRNTIPARLDEQKKIVERLSGIDFPAIRAQRDTTAAKLEQLQAELVKLGHGALLDTKRNELAAARNAVEAEINRNTSHRQSQTVPVEDRRPAIKTAMDKAAAEAARWRRMAAGEENTIRDLEAKIQACRDSWAVENARSFQAGNCPTCGQTLPEAALIAARDRFEADKKKSLQEAVDRANDAKASLAAARGRREEYIQAAHGAENEAGRLRAELEAYRPEAQPEILDLPGHTERLAAAEEKARSLDTEVERLEGETAAIRAEITVRVGTLQAEVEALNGELAKEAMLMPFRVFHDAAEPFGFLVRSHEDGDKLAFATDTVNLRYQFPGVTILAVECNYAAYIIDRCDRMPEKVRQRIKNSHMEVSRLCRWLSGLDLSACREIRLLHLSDACSSEFDFVRMVQRCVPAGVKVSACPKVSEV